MIRLDAATVLLQWATGGLLFLWVTSRRREVGIGYGWLLRGTFLAMAAGSVVLGRAYAPDAGRDLLAGATTLAALVALVVSARRRKAGVAVQRQRQEQRSARVAEMTGIERSVQTFDADAPEFPPLLDLVAPLLGFVGLLLAAAGSGTDTSADVLAVARTVVGALFLGAVSDAMLLGHWYLVQPGLPRGALLELIKWLGWTWPFEVALLLVPTGMVSVLDGSIDDGWNGLLGWFWVACAVSTIVLVVVTRAALKERAYSAVMAATGLLYLAIIMAFGTDLVARLLLTP
jgi:ABC-type multidrug transport system fused ATPase/permease subunit